MHKTHTHTLPLFDLIRVQNEAYALQSMTERALPPGSIHRSRKERAEEKDVAAGVVYYCWRGDSRRRQFERRVVVKYLNGEMLLENRNSLRGVGEDKSFRGVS